MAVDDIARAVLLVVLVIVTVLAVGKEAKLIPALEPIPPATRKLGLTMQYRVDAPHVAVELREVMVKSQRQYVVKYFAQDVTEIDWAVPPVNVTVPVPVVHP